MWKFSGKQIVPLHKMENYPKSNITLFSNKHKGHSAMLITKSNKTDNGVRNTQTEQRKTAVPFSRFKQVIQSQMRQWICLDTD